MNRESWQERWVNREEKKTISFDCLNNNIKPRTVSKASI